MKNPKISVVIPTKDRPQDLEKVFKELTKQTYKNFEVVVVEGGEKEPTQAVVEKWSKELAVIFSTQSGGLVAQENKAIKLITGDIFLRTDDDVSFNKNWLKEVANIFENPPDIGKPYKLGGVTGPTIVPPHLRKNRDVFLFLEKLQKGNFFWQAIGKIYFSFFMEGKPFDVGTWFKSGAFSLGSNFKRHAFVKAPRKVDFFQACNMAIPKKLVVKTGGFKEGELGIGEYNEAGIGFEVQKLGYTIVYNPKAIVYHLLSTSGIFSARPNAKSRMTNFVHFYVQYIKPNTLEKAFRFLAYIIFQNCYYSFMFLKTLNIRFLGGWVAPFSYAGKTLLRKLTK